MGLGLGGAGARFGVRARVWARATVRLRVKGGSVWNEKL